MMRLFIVGMFLLNRYWDKHPLPKEELEETINYCKHDVDATEKLIDIRKDYLKTKLNLGKRAGIDPVTAMSATNAKLTAMMLKAKLVQRNDGRDYVYPENTYIDRIFIAKHIRVNGKNRFPLAAENEYSYQWQS